MFWCPTKSNLSVSSQVVRKMKPKIAMFGIKTHLMHTLNTTPILKRALHAPNIPHPLKESHLLSLRWSPLVIL